MPTRYVALLRGINVGGNNPVSMKELRASFEKAGFEAVSTYINSGNVLFEATKTTVKALATKIERILEEDFKIPLTVVVRSHTQYRSVVNDAPKGFGKQPDKFRYDVVFLKEPLTAKAASKDLPRKEGVDEVWAGKGVIYYSRLIAKITSSRINRVVGTPVYKSMTIRNWNTTTKLLKLLDARTD